MVGGHLGYGLPCRSGTVRETALQTAYRAVYVRTYCSGMTTSRSTITPVPPATRSGGIPRHRVLSHLDVEILRFLTRFQIARPHHVAGWTGASPHTIDRRLRQLAQIGLVRNYVTPVDLRGSDGLRSTFCTVWTTTTAGAGYIGSWDVPGAGGPVTLPAPRISRLMSHHAIGVVDLAVWYRQQGFTLISEREVLSIERPFVLRAAGRPAPKAFWSVTIPGRTGIHPPDLGAVAPDGGMWCVELERATKTVAEYEDIIRAYRREGLGQVWHILTQATAKRVMEACTRLGVTWDVPPVPGVTASAPDGLIRLQGWLPGRSGLVRPAMWNRQFPRSSPAGIPVPDQRPDLAETWRLGRVVDIEQDEQRGGVFW